MQSCQVSGRRSAPASQPTLWPLLTEVMSSGLAQLAPGAPAVPDDALRRACRAALERLWCRRGALARALRRPRACTGTGHAAVAVDLAGGLDAASLQCERVLAAALGNAPPAPDRADAQGDDRWPYAAQDWAATLRQVVRWATAEPAVQLELMRLGAELLAPRFADASQCASPGPDDERAASAAAPAATPARAAESTADDLIDAAQPGCWFRMLLMERWTDVCVTWRSDKGHFFMFSSRLAGRLHTLSRSSLGRLIERGHFRRHAGSPPAPDGTEGPGPAPRLRAGGADR